MCCIVTKTNNARVMFGMSILQNEFCGWPKILIDGLQSRYVFIVLYIYAYTHKSSCHRNKINLLFNLLELTISLNYQFASYRIGIPRPPFLIFYIITCLQPYTRSIEL